MESRLGRLGAHPGALWVIKNIVSPLDRATVRVSMGHMPLLTSLVLPTLLLTVKGRKSGALRRVPLLYVVDNGDYLVAYARPQGERKNPWALNLAAADNAQISVKRLVSDVRVSLLDDAEADLAWPAIVEVWPALDVFYRSTGDRSIFRLKPD